MSGSILAYLEHELCDHSVELGALVAKALLPCTQGPEVFCSPWDNLVVEFKLNPAIVVQIKTGLLD